MEDQLDVYSKIISSIEDERGNLFSFDAPGRTGKTFIINLLLAKLLQMKHIALAGATSGMV